MSLMTLNKLQEKKKKKVLCLFFISRTSCKREKEKKISNNQKHLNHFLKSHNCLHVRLCPRGASEQFGSLVVKRRRGWREREEEEEEEEGARKRDVCYILSNLSSWC